MTANLKRPVRCGKCGGFLCQVEVLIYPTPEGPMLSCDNLTCRRCGWKNEFTVTIGSRKEEGDGKAQGKQGGPEDSKEPDGDGGD